MLGTTIIVTALLSAAPQSTPPTKVEIAHRDDAIHAVALDEHGDATGEVVVWSPRAGETQLDAVLPDGSYLTVRIDGDHVDVESEGEREAVAEQLTIIAAGISQASKGECIGYAVLTLAEVGLGHPIIAGATAYITACKCGPYIFEEWDSEEVC